MQTSGGKLSIEYEVISATAQKRIVAMQKSLDSLNKSAQKQVDDINTMSKATEKQAKITTSTYKRMGAAVIGLSAVVTGALYGIVRSSAYASMWMDQIGHQTTRIMTKLSEMLGLDEAVTAFTATLKNVGDELIAPEENNFWENQLKIFDEMSIKGKILSGILIVLGTAITLVGAGFALVSFDSLLLGLGLISTKGAFTAAVMTKLTGALALLKAALLGIVSAVGAVTLVLLAIAAVFVYLWAKTEHGIAQIESLKNTWNNFKNNIKDIGWLRAIGVALGNLGTIIFFEISTWIKQIPTIIKHYLSTGLLGKVLKMGKNIISWLIIGLDKMFPGFKVWFDNLITEAIKKFNILKDKAFNKGKEIINNLIIGIDSKLPGFKYILDHYGGIFNTANDDMIIKAKDTSIDIMDGYIGGFSQKEVDLALESYNVGSTIKYSTLEGVEGTDSEINAILDQIYKEMAIDIDLENAISELPNDVAIINTELGKIQSSIDINLNVLGGDISDTAKETIEAANAAMLAGEYVGSDIGTNIDPSSMPGGGDWTKSGTVNKTIDVTNDLAAYLAADPSAATDYGYASYSAYIAAGSPNKPKSSSTSTKTKTKTKTKDSQKKTSGSSGTGYYSKGGSYSASKTGGRPDNAATGAHVLRTGAVIAHQGEDIINLKSLLAGIREGGNSSNITINPVININSSGRTNDPIETNRIAEIVSKKMAEELRRISTNF